MIELARDSLNPELELLGILLNIADMRTRHSRDAFASLREHYGEKLLDTTIRSSIAHAESAERAVSILDYRHEARGRLGALVGGTHGGGVSALTARREPTYNDAGDGYDASVTWWVTGAFVPGDAEGAMGIPRAHVVS